MQTQNRCKTSDSVSFGLWSEYSNNRYVIFRCYFSRTCVITSLSSEDTFVIGIIFTEILLDFWLILHECQRAYVIMNCPSCIIVLHHHHQHHHHHCMLAVPLSTHLIIEVSNCTHFMYLFPSYCLAKS